MAGPRRLRVAVLGVLATFLMYTNIKLTRIDSSSSAIQENIRLQGTLQCWMDGDVCTRYCVRGGGNRTFTTYQEMQDEGFFRRGKRYPIGVMWQEDPDGSLEALDADEGAFSSLVMTEYILWTQSKVHQQDVRWVHVPLLLRDEICCASTPSERFCGLIHRLFRNACIYGMEDNSLALQRAHASFRGQHKKRKGERRWKPTGNETPLHTDDVDILLVIDRDACMAQDSKDHLALGPLYHELSQQGDAASLMEEWQMALGMYDDEGLPPITPGDSEDSSKDAIPKLLVVWLENRPFDTALPVWMHRWIQEFVGNHPRIDFRKQSYVNESTHVIFGVHGPHMAQMALLPRRRYVVEFFGTNSNVASELPRDYELLSRLLDHSYIQVWGGMVNPTREDRQKVPSEKRVALNFLEGVQEVEKLLVKAMIDLNVY